MRVMTYNIWNYTRPWEKRRDLIARLIKDVGPEVVALQETRHDWRHERGTGQGEQLAEMTGYHPTTVVAQVYIPILRVDEGLTLLTKEKPINSAVCELTLHPHEREDENHRVCQGITLMHDSKRVHVFNTHFSLSPVARVTNAVESARFVREQSEGEPALMMGDLNAEPDTPAIGFLLGKQEIDGEAGGFTDRWVAANGEDPGFTYASSHPVRRIDYVLGMNLPNGVQKAEVVGSEPVDGVFPSDHLGVVVDVPI
jgi:endonuclease/exonuclease/phosphatase family metal-dependent hydrolase